MRVHFSLPRLTQFLQHEQEMLDRLAEIKVSLLERFEQWRVNPSSTQIQSAPESVSHMPPQQLVAGRSIQSRDANTPTSSSTPTNSSDSQMARNGVHTGSGTGTKDFLERRKLVETVVPPLTSFGYSQGRETPGVTDMPKVAGASVNVTVVLPFDGLYLSLFPLILGDS
jgi:hypothetical protein